MQIPQEVGEEEGNAWVMQFLEPKYSDMIDDLLKKTYESE